MRSIFALLILTHFVATESHAADKPIRVLIVDGANNHDWRVTTDAIRATLESTELFRVDVETAPQSKMFRPARVRGDADVEERASLKNYVENHQTPIQKQLEPEFEDRWRKWNPKFSDYDTVLLNYNGRAWPQAMQRDFVRYVRNGGGVVLIHATNNGFRDWSEFNEIIGLGYNGKRNTARAECTKINPASGEAYLCCEGSKSGHGSRHPFLVTVRHPDHPVMKDLPPVWRHGRDELYHNLRGPARNMTILSSAYSGLGQRGTGQRGTGHHEPITMAIRYGEGRVIHTTMGHFWHGQTDWDALYCVGFQTLIARSCEFTATGSVTLDVPTSFPKDGQVSIKRPHQINWTVNGMPTRTLPQTTTEWKAKLDANPYALLTTEEQAESFQIASGYEIELVAAEPMVQEPVLAVWDAAGAMYVAEMRSYMQDEKGTGTKTLNNGRVKRLVDTDGDGVMDKSTIFVDGLNLPRMILPLDERIAIVETDITSVYAYTDTDGDGVADRKELLFAGRVSQDRKRSVEHQDSGLIWNLDNWIYVSYNNQRYRFTDGTWKSEPTMGKWAQWGLARDDVGNLFRSTNEMPLVAQVPLKYWAHVKRATGNHPRFVPNVGFPFERDFLISRMICPVGDKGPNVSSKPKFTSLCGQEIFRGTAFPRTDYGNLFFVDPTIHVVRKSVVETVHGKVTLQKTAKEVGENEPDEFLLSPDFNFRPVNTHTGPDGCLYVVDMHRGIIQDEPWFNDTSKQYARSKGFNEHIQHGRIWRIRHKDHQPRPVPNMLSESPLELLRHFGDSNGWVRDTAQKLIVLRLAGEDLPEDKRIPVIAALEAMVRFQPDRPITRLHALWTLEGVGEVDRSLIELALHDRDPRVQSAAIEIGEDYIRQEDEAFYRSLESVAAKSKSKVAKQLVMSLGWSHSERANELIDRIVRRHLTDDGVYLAAMASLWGRETSLVKAARDGSLFDSVSDPEKRNQLISQWNTGITAWDFKRTRLPDDWTSKEKWLAGGEGIYFELCSRCHGTDGNGQRLPGHELLIAPPLAGSPRVTGDPDKMIRILLHGLSGPVNGQTYGAGLMPRIEALGQGDPNRITQVANFVRYAWGNGQTPIPVEEVKRVIEETKNRKRAPYTLAELGLDSGGFVNRELEKELMDASIKELAKSAETQGDASRGKALFYNNKVACFSCHDPPPGAAPMGPDLSMLSLETTTEDVVDSILRPSKKVNKAFGQINILMSDGTTLSGLRVKENDDELVLRNTSNNKLVRVPRTHVEEVIDSKRSLMPDGLVTQLRNRSQFFDLVKFITDQRAARDGNDSSSNSNARGTFSSSLQNWKTRRLEILDGMQTVMGLLPADEKRVELDVRVEEEVDAGNYVRRLITFQSEPDCRTPAYLCIPKSALNDEQKVPAVLCLHPTDDRVGHKVVLGLGGRKGRQYAAELAERGFVTLSPAYPHLANYWPNLGKLGYVSGTMKAIWDNTRALDLLAAMPEVDAERGFGVIGHSLGGHNAIYTAVFDERISVLVSSCGFDSFADYYDGVERNWYFGKGWCQIRYMPRMSNYREKLDAIPFDFPDLLAALAPRRVFINAPLNDSNFQWKSVAKCADHARSIYKIHGVGPNLIVRHPDCGHDFPDELREEAYGVIATVLLYDANK